MTKEQSLNKLREHGIELVSSADEVAVPSKKQCDKIIEIIGKELLYEIVDEFFFKKGYVFLPMPEDKKIPVYVQFFKFPENL